MLVADDDEFVSGLISKVLGNYMGMEIVTVDTGSKAIAQALTGEFDAAIIDLILPQTSGLEAIKVIKEMMPEFPIIAITGESLNSRLEFLKSCGVTCVFNKPIRFSALIEELNSLINTGRELPVGE
ncbi:MAG: response regulator [candidate division Zixibacteria bacterium]